MPYTTIGPFTDGAPPALSAATMDHIEAGITAAHALIPSSPTQPSWVLNVKDFGAVGNGSTDDSVAFKNCIAAALATRSSGTAPVRCEVVIPPGDYRITQNDSLMTPSTGVDDGAYGLIIRGFGKDVTKIVFDPATTSLVDPFVGNLFSARKRARYFVIRDMTFQSNDSQANCFYFFGDGQGSNMNQSCRFINLNFIGNWQRVFGFDGDEDANLNSEMVFDGISGATAVYSDAFFKVGGISGTFNQQNQFLDYWFYNSHFILNGGTLIDFVKGGSAHFFGGSWSAASGSSPAMTFIRLRENFNNTSAANFTFSGIRLEPKASNHTVLLDEIGHGTITFENCIDVSSIQNTAAIQYPLRRHIMKNPWGTPIHTTMTYRNCSLHGYDSYEGLSGTANRGWVSYEGCYFWRGTGGNMAVATQDQGADGVVRWTGARPRYRFAGNWNCDDVVYGV